MTTTTDEIMGLAELYRTAGGRKEYHACKDELRRVVEALVAERDALKAELAELRAQEPIGYVYTHNGLAQGALNSKSMPAGTPLYLAASAKEKTE